jgi:hypothetical protein
MRSENAKSSAIAHPMRVDFTSTFCRLAAFLPPLVYIVLAEFISTTPALAGSLVADVTDFFRMRPAAGLACSKRKGTVSRGADLARCRDAREPHVSDKFIPGRQNRPGRSRGIIFNVSPNADTKLPSKVRGTCSTGNEYTMKRLQEKDL